MATATSTAAGTATGTEIQVSAGEGGGWITVCRATDLTPGRGVAVALPDGRQAAVFLTRAGSVHALSNRDPFSGAYVLSRGLLGSADGVPFVASPLLKQRFALTDGRCLDDEEVSVPVYGCRIG